MEKGKLILGLIAIGTAGALIYKATKKQKQPLTYQRKPGQLVQKIIQARALKQ